MLVIIVSCLLIWFSVRVAMNFTGAEYPFSVYCEDFNFRNLPGRIVMCHCSERGFTTLIVSESPSLSWSNYKLWRKSLIKARYDTKSTCKPPLYPSFICKWPSKYNRILSCGLHVLRQFKGDISWKTALSWMKGRTLFVHDLRWYVVILTRSGMWAFRMRHHGVWWSSLVYRSSWTSQRSSAFRTTTVW